MPASLSSRDTQKWLNSRRQNSSGGRPRGATGPVSSLQEECNYSEQTSDTTPTLTGTRGSKAPEQEASNQPHACPDFLWSKPAVCVHHRVCVRLIEQRANGSIRNPCCDRLASSASPWLLAATWAEQEPESTDEPPACAFRGPAAAHTAHSVLSASEKAMQGSSTCSSQ